jgi:hypothetical protein
MITGNNHEAKSKYKNNQIYDKKNNVGILIPKDLSH